MLSQIQQPLISDPFSSSYGYGYGYGGGVQYPGAHALPQTQYRAAAQGSAYGGWAPPTLTRAHPTYGPPSGPQYSSPASPYMTFTNSAYQHQSPGYRVPPAASPYGHTSPPMSPYATPGMAASAPSPMYGSRTASSWAATPKEHTTQGKVKWRCNIHMITNIPHDVPNIYIFWDLNKNKNGYSQLLPVTGGVCHANYEFTIQDSVDRPNTLQSWNKKNLSVTIFKVIGTRNQKLASTNIDISMGLNAEFQTNICENITIPSEAGLQPIVVQFTCRSNGKNYHIAPSVKQRPPSAGLQLPEGYEVFYGGKSTMDSYNKNYQKYLEGVDHRKQKRYQNEGDPIRYNDVKDLHEVRLNGHLFYPQWDLGMKYHESRDTHGEFISPKPTFYHMSYDGLTPSKPRPPISPMAPMVGIHTQRRPSIPGGQR